MGVPKKFKKDTFFENQKNWNPTIDVETFF